MIPIRKINIDKALMMWISQVHNHLHTEHTGRHRLLYRDSGGRIRHFNTWIRKYRAMYEDHAGHIAAVTADEKDRIWSAVESFLNSGEYLAGDKQFCEEWSKWQDDNLGNPDLKAVVKDIFVSIYDVASGKIGYKVLKELDIRTCPYCNRHYTFTLEGDRNEFKTRAEFDHFYDKSTYPLLAVTFFNLVPSCKECNHGKRTNPCGTNPYFDDFRSKFVIVPRADEGMAPLGETKEMDQNEIRKISKEDDFDVDFSLPDDEAVKEAEKMNMETLGLRPLYNMHKDYVMEIVEKAVAYDALTRNGIVDRFQGLFHNEADVYNLIFGTYLSAAEHSGRPLSKLTADILDQLGIHPNS